MQPSIPTARNLPSLTGLRFAAAFGVWLSHAAFLHPAVWGPVLPLLIQLGPAGVSLFFVLSGFVLTRSARPDDTARAFWRRRAVKIYPSHLTAWAAVTALTVAAGTVGALSVADFLPGLVLVQTWAPAAGPLMAGNIIAWSLCCEVFFYVLFPLLLRLVNRVPERRLTAAVVVVAGLVWACPALSYVFTGPRLTGFPLDLPFTQVWFAYFFPPCRLPEFVLGMLLAAQLRSGARPRRSGVCAAAALLLGALVVGARFLPVACSFAATGVIATALLVRATAASDLRGSRCVLRSRTMVFLGEISYAFYLTHTCALLAVDQGARFVGHERSVPLIMACGLAASILLAWLLHSTVEEPCMRRFAKPGAYRGRHLEPAPAAAPAPVAAPATAPVAAPAPAPAPAPEQSDDQKKLMP
ncbi:acyltransferase [Streptomyces sp. CRN 30]|uniref:acyltransferase family protein n=1 Tax=Streptomyces sp. CRN 30 TaxID=3075613 RepID=UPI002A7F43AB|nr:acyltransferase [Streptomyces sp. CRN 30]